MTGVSGFSRLPRSMEVSVGSGTDLLGKWYGLAGLVVCLSFVGLLYGLSWTQFQCACCLDSVLHMVLLGDWCDLVCGPGCRGTNSLVRLPHPHKINK